MRILKKTDRSSSFSLGIAHFAVDFACTYLLTTLSDTLSYPQLLACAILYNGLAFAFQLPIGALGDGLGLYRGLASLGCILVALGAWIPQPLILCVLIGLGNACFHAGGGREALKRSKGRSGPVGRFVAPGAIGIFLGPRLSAPVWFCQGVLPLCLLALAAVLFFTRRQKKDLPVSPLSLSRTRLAGVICCMFLTVLLRSYMGTVLRYEFLSETALAFLFTLCIFGGKFFGGTLADRFGALRFSILAQGICVLLFVLSVWLPLLALPAIFLFNTTMAITATQLYRAFPKYPGTMFGLTTFALYLGVLPRLLGWENILFSWWGLGILSLMSAVLLVGGLILLEGGPARDRTAHIPGAVPGTDTAP